MDRTVEIAFLIRKRLEGTITSEELIVLQKWAESDQIYMDFLNKVLHENILWEDALKWMELEKLDQESWTERLEKNTLSKISSSRPERPRKSSLSLIKYIPYAAAIVLFTMIAIIFYVNNRNTSSENPRIVHDINPGTNKAKLTLADGRTIELSSDKGGVVVGKEITYDDGAFINASKADEVSYATLSTPRGGKYQITLPDGTRVWLNAASTLKYPTKFSEFERIVDLEGEAYFDVTQQNKKDIKTGTVSTRIPFLVRTPNQVIEVIGTQFNVNAYAEDSTTETTLVEGSVLLSGNNESLKLFPGEQGITSPNSLFKRQVDVSQYIAWKNNKFIFYETELRDAMKELSRWYDLDIAYESNIPQTHFYGEISRDKGLAEVLKILEAGGVKFRMEKVGKMNRLVVLQ